MSAVKIKQENRTTILVSIAISLSFSIVSFYPLFTLIPDRLYITSPLDIASPVFAGRTMPNITTNELGPCGIDPRNLSCIPAPCEQVPPPQSCLDNSDMHNNTNNSNSIAFYTKGPDMPTPRSEAAVASIGTRIYASLIVPLKL